MSQYRITKEYGPEDLKTVSLREYVSMSTKEKSDGEKLDELEEAYASTCGELAQANRAVQILSEALATAAGLIEMAHSRRASWTKHLDLHYILAQIAGDPLKASTTLLNRVHGVYAWMFPQRVVTRCQWDRMRPYVAPRIYRRDKHTCVYCGSRKKLTIDHVVPVSKGGRHIDSNLVTCCNSCNLSKGDKTLDEWKR